MKVLVIEDDPTDRKLAGEVLKLSGHIVREHTAAEEALAVIAIDRPDIILLDLRLPGADGLTLAHRLKADATTRDIPIVAVTAFPEMYPREVVLAAGCEACIVKPIDTRDFSRTLEAVAERRPR